MSQPYLPPLDKLLTLGDPAPFGEEWLDYLAMGIGSDHVPELIRMAYDGELEADGRLPQVWAGLHAWRALGQLRAAPAAVPLMRLMVQAGAAENDWAIEEIPEVLGMIGPPALAPLQEMLPQLARDDNWYGTSAVSIALVAIARGFPETREAVAATLARQMESWPRLDPTTNAFLIVSLIQVAAVEAAPTIEAAFAADAVDTMVVGDWEDVQVGLGLLAKRATVRTPRIFAPRVDEDRTADSARSTAGKARSKARHKAEKAARKRNRKKR